MSRQNHRTMEPSKSYKLVAIMLFFLAVSWFVIHPMLVAHEEKILLSEYTREKFSTLRQSQVVQYLDTKIHQLGSTLNESISEIERDLPPLLHIPTTSIHDFIVAEEERLNALLHRTVSGETVATTKTTTNSPDPAHKQVPAKQQLPKLHAVTYASHQGRDDRFCRAIESAVRHNYELVILGWKVPWKGLAQKLDAAYKYSLTLPDDDLMLFTDAFDVLFTDQSEKILRIFLNRGYKILFAGECGCWPHIMENPKICRDMYPVSPTPYRYLNSGTWIGVVKHVREMLLAVIHDAGNNFENANDQKLVADMFMSGKHNIQLDYHAEIFQSMHRTDPPDLPFCNPFSDMELAAEGKWHNRRTNTTPAVIHFNGGGKAHHLAMEGRMWYKARNYYESVEKRTALEEAQLITPTTPTGTTIFRDLCGNYLATL